MKFWPFLWEKYVKKFTKFMQKLIKLWRKFEDKYLFLVLQINHPVALYILDIVFLTNPFWPQNYAIWIWSRKFCELSESVYFFRSDYFYHILILNYFFVRKFWNNLCISLWTCNFSQNCCIYKLHHTKTYLNWGCPP